MALEDEINKSAYDLLKTLDIVRSKDGHRPVLSKIYSQVINGEQCLIACDGIRLMIVRLGLEPFNHLVFQIPMDRFWEIDFHKDSVYLTDQTRAMNFLGYSQYPKLNSLMLDLDSTDFLIEIDKYGSSLKTKVNPSIKITQLCASEFGVYFDSEKMPFNRLVDSRKDRILVGINKLQKNQLNVECKSFVFIMVGNQRKDCIKVDPHSETAKSLFFRKPLFQKSLFPDWNLNNASSK